VGVRKRLVAAAIGALALVIAAVSAPLASAASGWTIQPTPNPSGVTEVNLNGVSCASSTACIGVGFSEGSSGPIVTLAESSNGTTWAPPQVTPNPAGATGADLSGVSCISATACTAVGNYSDSSGNTKTLAEVWTGRRG